MLDPAELYRLEPDAPTPPEPVLVMVLDGFVDAGAAARLAADSLLAAGPGQRVARFDVDQLVDYRSRRPLVRDRPVDLLLGARAGRRGAERHRRHRLPAAVGPEPDTQWERFAAAVEQLVGALGVRLVVDMTGIPMAVPHTRPIGVTVHGTSPT